MHVKTVMKENEFLKEKYLELLAQQYPSRYAAFTEIINLQAILNLPKGTEHFVSDLHGEYDAFCHIRHRSRFYDSIGSSLR